MTTSMTDNLRNLVPVNLVPDADRLAVSEDNVLYMHMLRAKLEFDIADMDMDFEESESVSVRKSGKSHYDKKAMKRKGSTKRFRDRSRKCAHEGHVWNVYNRGMSGDYAERGKRLKKTGRPQKVNVHKDTNPVSEQELWYVGEYETRQICEGVTITMEWPVPEAVYGDGNEPEPMSFEDANDYSRFCLKMAKYWMHKFEQVQLARYDGKLAKVLRKDLENGMADYYYEHALI